MKTFAQFLDEALAASLIKAGIRQLTRTKAAQKAVAKQLVSATPAAVKAAPKQIKLPQKIIGFQTGRGTRYTFNPDTKKTISVTAPGHHSTPAGAKPRSDWTTFYRPDYAHAAQNQFVTRTDWNTGEKIKNWKKITDPDTGKKITLPYERTPKVGLHPVERWYNYPAGVKYGTNRQTGKPRISKGGESMLHMGSKIINVTPGGPGKTASTIGLRPDYRKDILKALKSQPKQTKPKLKTTTVPSPTKERLKQTMPTASQTRVSREAIISQPKPPSTYRNLGVGTKETIKTPTPTPTPTTQPSTVTKKKKNKININKEVASGGFGFGVGYAMGSQNEKENK